MQNKHQNDGVELEDSTFCEQAQRDVLMGPALRDPVGHECGD